MSTKTNLTTQRLSARTAFQTTFYQARLVQAAERLVGRFQPLTNFKVLPGILQGERTYLGMDEVPLEKITGSVRRSDDFDRRFRPLRRQVGERWVSTYQRVKAGEWTPVRLYKYGEEYYVEDGHYRLSTAQVLDRCCILAEVWEITPHPRQATRRPLKSASAQATSSCCEDQMVRA